MGTSVEDRLLSLGVVLPPLPAPAANYLPCVRTDSFLFLSGQGPCDVNGKWALGRVGDTVTLAEAYEHARLAALRLLSVTRTELGSLDRVLRVVKVLGFVNATPSFTHHSKVVDGCSDLLVAAFGECGRHARSAVGTDSLPRGMTVEVEAVIQFR